MNPLIGINRIKDRMEWDKVSFEEAYGTEMAYYELVENERKPRLPPKPSATAGIHTGACMAREDQEVFTCESVGQRMVLGFTWKQTAEAMGRTYAALSYWLSENNLNGKKLRTAFEHGGVAELKRMDEKLTYKDNIDVAQVHH